MYTNINHRQFLEVHRTMNKLNNKSSDIHKISLNSGSSTTNSEEGKIHLPNFKEFKIIKNKIELSFEAIPLLFYVDGHDKNFLLFVISYYMKEDCTFMWNRIVAEHYADFYEAVRGLRPSFDTVRQSIYSLEKNNLIRKKDKGNFMINPLLVPDSPTNRRKFISDYAKISNENNVFDLFLEK